jgi:CRISPR/Cas system-associated endoribonuclease Cas2
VASYIITYDLNRAGQNYESLNKAIQSYGTWAKIATTTYVVISSDSAENIRNNLQQYIDNNDELFVGKLNGEAAWYGLSDKISSWLQTNLNK